MWISPILGATSIPILLRKTLKWRFQFNPPTHSWKRQGWRNFCCCCKTSYTGTVGNWNNCKRPTCYTMITLFTKIDITIKVTKSFTWVSHMALQAGSLSTEPSNSVPGSSDRRAQLLMVGNFEIIWNLEKILACVVHHNICNHTSK